jgi:hypothetical protein
LVRNVVILRDKSDPRRNSAPQQRSERALLVESVRPRAPDAARIARHPWTGTADKSTTGRRIINIEKVHHAMRTFVIAGITGHVGSVVGSELLARGERIKAIVRDPNRGAPWRDRGAEIAVGSLEDRPFLGKTLAGAAGFFVLLPPNDTETGDYFAAQRRTSDPAR